MKRLRAFGLSLLIVLLSFSLSFAENEGRLLRFPDIHQDQVVFSYSGDLWTVSSEGGTARRLTTHDGYELMPKFSPDGKWIAFTGKYDGNDNVFVIPAEGGEPRQLTYLQAPTHLSERSGPENMVLEWYPDSERILFMSRRYTYHTWFGQLYSVSIDGGIPEQLRLPKGGLTSFHSSGEKIAYNRNFRNFRTWKRYTGGLAQDIWIYNFTEDTTIQVTDWVGTDTEPAWIGEKILFTSDRPPSENSDQKEPGKMNIWEYDTSTEEFAQRTFFKEWDVKWASGGPEQIVFENAGYLYVMNAAEADAEPQKLTVQIPGDRRFTLPGWEDTKNLISTFNVAPTGKRAVFEARGDIYTVPKEHGDIRNLTQTPGIREKYAAWSPDGKWIAYFSDRHGSDDLYLIRDEMGAEETRITSNADNFRYPPIWSPDSKKLAFSDKDNNLWYVDIEKKEPVLADSSDEWEIRDYTWSPDSRWLAYSKPHENDFRSVYIYNLESEEVHQVTSSMTNDWNPAWDPQGQYLYFLSDRNLNPSLGTFDWTYNYHRTAGIYLTTLRKALKNPFAPRSDEVEEEEEKQDSDGDKKDKKSKEEEQESPDVTIDFDGIQGRMIAVPVDADNYRSLHAAEGALFYITYPTQGLGGKVEPIQSALHGFDMEKREATEIAKPVGNYDISPEKKHLIYQSSGSYYVIDAKPAEASDAKPLDLSGMEAEVDYQAEWREIFEEAWRYQKNYFYNPGMNEVDWQAMKEKYEVLVPHVAHRYDLNYVIGEMIAELSNSHTYVGGGDYPDLDQVKYGQLGIDMQVNNGRYQITKIYRGDNTREERISPLTKPGVDISEGDYILAIDGKGLTPEQNFNAALENKVGKQVVLTVSSSPRRNDSRKVTVEPIGSEYELRHWDWVKSNREKVDDMSNGQIGYIYLTDMSNTGLNEFVEQYYPQIRKKGLIVDVRYNGGGFVDQLILERLRRTLIGMGMSRDGGTGTVPPQVFTGYAACLINGFSASDGDIFPYYFRKYGLGELIGTRTWGGVRGIRGNPGIMDGGYVYPPEFSRYDLDSTWNMENYGVAPDIRVDNLPHEVVQGRDPQLEKAVEVLMKKIEENPEGKNLELPPRPDFKPPYPEEYYELLDINPDPE